MSMLLGCVIQIYAQSSAQNAKLTYLLQKQGETDSFEIRSFPGNPGQKFLSPFGVGASGDRAPVGTVFWAAFVRSR